MSVYHMGLVWRTECQHSEKIVLLYIADCVNDSSATGCWPSVETIAARCGLTRQGVVGILRRLEERGWLLVDRSRAQRRSNVYRLQLADAGRSEIGPDGATVNVVDVNVVDVNDVAPTVNVVDRLQSTSLTDIVNVVAPNRKEPEGNRKRTVRGARKRASLPTSKFSPPTLQECQAYAVELGLPANDGAVFWTGKEALGWTNAGRPMKNWKATLLNYKLRGWTHSLQGGRSPITRSSPPPAVPLYAGRSDRGGAPITRSRPPQAQPSWKGGL